MIRVSLKIMSFLCVLGVAGGCAHRAMDRAVASWQDQPASSVITVWGQPSEELRVSGKHLLLWNTYDGKLALPDRKISARRSDPPGCTRLLEIGGDGRIVSGAWEGNDCPGWFSGWTR
jgi:hypothetical protein